MEPKTPAAEKDLFKELMKMLIALLKKNLEKIKNRKQGKDHAEGTEEDEDLVSLFLKIKFNQDHLNSLQGIAEKSYNVMGKYLGEQELNQLKFVIDKELNQMQTRLNEQNQSQQQMNQSQTNSPPKPQPGQNTQAKEEEEKLRLQEEREKEEEKKKEEEEERKKKEEEEEEKKRKKKKGDGEEEKENERGEPIEGGMTEEETVDAGRQLGKVLQDPKFQEEMGINKGTEAGKKEAIEMDDMGDKASSMKTSSQDKMTPSPPGGSPR